MVNFNKCFPNIDHRCITLKNRAEKRRRVIKQFKSLRMGKPNFYMATKNKKNPKRGCLTSHLAVIREALKKGTRYLLVLEDDFLFKRGPLSLKTAPPGDWHMLYLGGTVSDVYSSMDEDWVKMRCWTTHAYIINLTDEEFVSSVLEMESYPDEVDRFYRDRIHTRYNCYMCNPMICIQQEGYSDIEGKKVNYDFMIDTLNVFKTPEHEISEDGAYVLKLADVSEENLPKVSVITPTYNRRELFSLTMRNIESQNYPRELLEWIIVDDSDDPAQMIDDLVPSWATHIKIDREAVPVSVAYKRNLAIEKSSGEIIVHMDDDDYYPESSVMARVKLLLKERDSGIECVGCSKVGVYDLANDASTISTSGSLTLSEASMAYWKSFWETKQFNSMEYKGEYFSFIKSRFHQVMDVPYPAVVFALTHYSNYTEELRQVKETNLKNKDTDEEINFINTWNEDTQYFIKSLATYLKSKRSKD